ncbi:LTA synthase family protein [Nocardioides marmoriginsengisoli]|uniref:LTA synthase family protein n=1 Tax=Nocardioides marmoriginsengisoli TaxID=661483 RepID=A0A3N0CDJ5_9ACTN|nr:LTA synthase family protein [Nocardioides marmoriginsengisoli]RNL61369.1 LTA synthase family protein [Nocardioides marmoriginsengisoli]
MHYEPAKPRAAAVPSTRRTLIWGLRFSAIAAIGLTFVLELSGLITGAPKWWAANLLGISFVADILVVWLILLVLIGVTNRVVLSTGLLGVFVFVVAVANRIKLNLRSEPLYPSDTDFLREPGFLTTMVSPAVLVIAALVVAGIVVATVVLSRRRERKLIGYWPKGLSTPKRLAALGARVAIVGIAVAMLANTLQFNDPGNRWRQLYEVSPNGWRNWNQVTNYQAHGFIGGFLYNMPTLAMDTPPTYSKVTMETLAARYEHEAARINAHRTGSLDDTNVVFVLSESFSDPTRLDGFKLAEDPIPRTRALMGSTASGTMLAQLLGGGTANMEFETLTGQSIGLFVPQLQSPYQQLVTQYRDYPSAVGWFASHGHTPIAIHPFNTGMYKRKSVYKAFGFESFIHDSTMAENKRIDDSEFISDESAFDEVERQISKSEKPLMINLVTMQNHIPMDDSYDDPIKVSGIGGGQANRVGNYARGLAHTDEALADFLEDLKESGEKTVVVFYGDHLPGIYGSDVKGANSTLRMRETPFLLWSSEGNQQRPLPVTSPIFFLPLLYDVADAPVPPYFALLERLRTRVSAIEQGRFLTPNGDQVDPADLPPDAKQVLEDARLMQYDASIGNRYVLDQMWPGAIRK